MANSWTRSSSSIPSASASGLKTPAYYLATGQTYDAGRHVEILQNGCGYDQPWFVEPPYADGGGGYFGEQPVWDDPEQTAVSDLRAGATIDTTACPACGGHSAERPAHADLPCSLRRHQGGPTLHTQAGQR